MSSIVLNEIVRRAEGLFALADRLDLRLVTDAEIIPTPPGYESEKPIKAAETLREANHGHRFK